MKRLFLIIVAFVFACTSSVMAQKLDSKIGNDPAVRIGKLENGMTYYIRQNAKPEGRVEFRLAVNAGSNQEDDDQQGLAHFTEHMAFNGIEGYPHNTMISELQKIGVIFGLGINAYTSFDETVYEITMPTDDQKYIDMGINILYGWAHGLLYDPQEIEDERGVISEEWRMGNGASDRMRKVWFPVVFTNSLYAKRLPIGLIEIIQGFKPEVIRRFYNDWYRPDLQAVIVVGDINPDAIEKQIKEKFSSIPAKENPRPKVIPSVDNNKEPLVAICTDKEAQGNQVLFVRKFPHKVMTTVQDYKDYMTRELYNSMYASRMSELQQTPNFCAIGLSAGYDEFLGNLDAYMNSGTAKEGRVIETMQTMMREDYRVLKYGFLESELKRAKEEMMDRYERAEKEADKTESSRFASRYVANYLHHDPIPGAKRELNYAKKYLESITLEEVNALAKQWITPENFVAVVMMPEKDGLKVPTEAEILAIINDKSLANVEPYVDTYKEQEIIEKETLKAGHIVSRKDLPEVGATELTLSNGIKVVTKKTDYKNDEILFSAQSKGGTSLYYECDIPSLSFASELVDRGGIADMDFNTLQKKLKGKKIGLTPYISGMSEGLSGSTSPKDLDLFCQYVNAFFTHPRKDTAAYSLVMDETREQIKMIMANPMYQFFSKLVGELSQHDPYQVNMLNYDEEFLERVDYERAFYLYQERFANPADFTFFFTGSFDQTELEGFIETYIASMPTTGTMENYKTSVFKSFPEKSDTKTLYAGAEDASSWVGLAFSEKIEWSHANEVMVDVISEALSIELIETIREKMGGVYSPMVQMSASELPEPRFITLVMFSCDPNNTDKLSNAVLNILEKFAKKGPKKETLAKVKEQMARSEQEDQQKNSYWHNYIVGQYFSGSELGEYKTTMGIVNGITVKDIAAFMQKNFKIDHRLRVDLYPEHLKGQK